MPVSNFPRRERCDGLPPPVDCWPLYVVHRGVREGRVAGRAVSSSRLWAVATRPPPTEGRGRGRDRIARLVVLEPGGGRVMKHSGPAFRWLACEAVGLPVVLA